jgi:hypothetical protein
LALTLIAVAHPEYAASGTAINCNSTLNVAAGDLLIALCGWEGAASSAFKVSDSDGTTNVMDLLAEVKGTSVNNFARIAYKIAASAKASSTIRLSSSASLTNVYFTVYQFRPDSGETVTKDAGPSSASNNGSTAVQTGNISTTGTDEVVLAVVRNYLNSAKSSYLIAEGAPDGYDEQPTFPTFASWYKLFTSAQTDIHAQVTMATSTQWDSDIIAFKSVAASGSPYTLSCGAGSFALTGQAVATQYNRRLGLGTGSFSLTGVEVSLLRSAYLSLGIGSYALAGQAAALKAGHRLGLDAGAFVLTGQDVEFLRGRGISCEAATFALAGQGASLRASRLLPLGAGAFVLTGMNVYLLYSAVSTECNIMYLTFSSAGDVILLTSQEVDVTFQPDGEVVL